MTSTRIEPCKWVLGLLVCFTCITLLPAPAFADLEVEELVSTTPPDPGQIRVPIRHSGDGARHLIVLGSFRSRWSSGKSSRHCRVWGKPPQRQRG